MKHPKTVLAVILVGLVTVNTASAEWFKEFGDQANTKQDTRRVGQEMFAQSRSVATDGLREERRDHRWPQRTGRDITRNLPGR